MCCTAVCDACCWHVLIHALLSFPLRLSHNELTTLPDSFGELSGLEQLNVKYQRNGGLLRLPSTIGAMKGLRRLDAKGNGLTVLPAAITAMGNLELLHLLDNRLESVPAGILRMPHLFALYLDGNQLVNVSSDVSTLGSPVAPIKYLGLSGNRFRGGVPEEVLHVLRGRASEAVTVNLEGNAIDAAPSKDTFDEAGAGVRVTGGRRLAGGAASKGGTGLEILLGGNPVCEKVGTKSSIGGGIVRCDQQCNVGCYNNTQASRGDPQASMIGDGDCDQPCNVATCNFDGGDCAPSCLAAYDRRGGGRRN